MVLLGNDGSLKTWVLMVSALAFLQALPFEWNWKTKFFQVKSQSQGSVYLLRIGISLFYILFQILQIIGTWEHSSTKVTMHTVTFMTVNILALSIQIFGWEYRNGIVYLYNNLVNYEKSWHSTRKSFSGDSYSTRISDLRKKYKAYQLMTKRLLLLQAFFGSSVPIVYSLNLLLNPCYPVYVGFLLSNQCQITKLGTTGIGCWDLKEVLVKCLMTVASYTTAGHLGMGACYHFGVALLLHGHIFRSYIIENTVEIMKMKNVNDKTYEVAWNMRKLQILLIRYRECYSKGVLGSTILGFIFCEILCLYNSIKAVQNGISIFSGMFIVYAWIAIAAVWAVVFFLGALSDVYRASHRACNEVKQNKTLSNNKWFKKWHKSLPILKIYFGGSNYLEPLTPLNMENFVINQTVSLLILY